MHDDKEAMEKLCLSVSSQFFEVDDILFSYGEMNTTVFILLKGWVHLCLGGVFRALDSEEENQPPTPTPTRKDLENAHSLRRHESVSTKKDFVRSPTKVARQETNLWEYDKLDFHLSNKAMKQSEAILQDSRFTDAYAKLSDREQWESREFAYIPAPAFFAESSLFLSEAAPAQYSAKCSERYL